VRSVLSRPVSPRGYRLLGTYRDQPAAGHQGMTIGIEQFRAARELWLDRMLLQPFRGAAGAYAITWRGAA
jgi:hypothetical protein